MSIISEDCRADSGAAAGSDPDAVSRGFELLAAAGRERRRVEQIEALIDRALEDRRELLALRHDAILEYDRLYGLAQEALLGPKAYLPLAR